MIDCAGAPRELGRAQGAALGSSILAVREALSELEALRLDQPRFLPFGLFLKFCELRARGLLREPLWRLDPETAERIEGIADGSGADLGTLYLLNALEPMLSFTRGRAEAPVPSPAGCSAVALRGARSSSGEPLIARNFDYLPLAQPFFFVRRSRPSGGARALEFTLAPLAGAIDGVNEKGLAIAYDYAYTLDDGTPAPPVSAAIADALAHCATTAEAAERIARRARWGGALLMLADAGGDIASFELSSTRSALRRPAPGQDSLVHSNAFCMPETRAVEVSRDARFHEKAPRALRGKRVHESAEHRGARLEQLVAKAGALSADGLAALMADHGPDAKASGLSPCVHSDYWNTTACVQLLPKSRALRTSFSYACEAKYSEASL